jgi:hypothetical protein
MTRTILTAAIVYKFSELSDKAKNKALDHFRDMACYYTYWYESVFEDCKAIFDILGILSQRNEPYIDFKTKGKKLRIISPNISFSGFSSQGDGASFEGSWYYKPGMSKAIRAYAPKDSKLYTIAKDLHEIQKRNRYNVRSRIFSVSHQYAHEHTVRVESEFYDGTWVSDETNEAIKEAIRNLMRWIYSRLNDEYNYHTSDEYILELIDSNGYEFTENGKLI